MDAKEPTPTNGEGIVSNNEAPQSFNVRFIMQDLDCQLTIREITEGTLAFIDTVPDLVSAVIGGGATSTRPSAPPAAPGIAPPPSAPAPQAPPPSAPSQEEIIPVDQVSLEFSKNKGIPHLVCQGGRYKKFGLTAWEEVIPTEVESWRDWQRGMWYQAPPPLAFMATTDQKRVSRFIHADEMSPPEPEFPPF